MCGVGSKKEGFIKGEKEAGRERGRERRQYISICIGGLTEKDHAYFNSQIGGHVP